MKGWGITTFPAHDAVACLRCQTPLGSLPIGSVMAMLGIGTYSKKCPQCQLVTSYDVSPAEAAAIELEEPDWRARFETHCARWPKLPRYLQEDSAFEATMRDWRRFHRAAGAVEAMMALSALRIFPPRNLIVDTLRTTDGFEEQHDNHMWLIMSQRSWRIIAIEDRVMILDSFGDKTQVDLTRAKWEKHTEKAVEALKAAYP